MNGWGWTLSIILHGLIVLGAIAGQWFSPDAPVREVSNDPLCTIPLDVTAVADISTAPISKPKAKQLKGQEEDRIDPPVLPDPAKQPVPPAPDLSPPAEPKPEPEPSQPPVIPSEPLVVEPEKPAVPKGTPTPEKAKEIVENVLPKPEKMPPKPKKPKSPKPRKQPAKAKPSASSPTDAISKILGTPEVKKQKVKDKKHKGKKHQDAVDALQDMDQDLEEGGQSETPETDPNSQSTVGAPRVGPQMAMSDIDRLRRAVYDVWQIPLRVSEGGDFFVVVDMVMNRNGTVASAQIVRSKSTTRHPAYDLGVESILRVIEYFKVNPLPLSSENYKAWKTITLTFDANQDF